MEMNKLPGGAGPSCRIKSMRSAAGPLELKLDIAARSLRLRPGDGSVVGKLSGGEKRPRGPVPLALVQPDMLLLDEQPTMSDANRAWLEKFLAEYPSTVIAVNQLIATLLDTSPSGFWKPRPRPGIRAGKYFLLVRTKGSSAWRRRTPAGRTRKELKEAVGLGAHQSDGAQAKSKRVCQPLRGMARRRNPRRLRDERNLHSSRRDWGIWSSNAERAQGLRYRC